MAGLGCTSQGEVGGVWRSPSLVQGPLTGSAPGLAVELTLGHYGPDVAGLVRFYRDPLFEQPLDPAAPFRDCACLLLHKARWHSASQRVDLLLEGCQPGLSPQAPLLVRGALSLVGAELEASLVVAAPGSEHLGVRQSFALERPSGEVPLDLGCPAPSELDDANPASGR